MLRPSALDHLVCVLVYRTWSDHRRRLWCKEWRASLAYRRTVGHHACAVQCLSTHVVCDEQLLHELVGTWHIAYSNSYNNGLQLGLFEFVAPSCALLRMGLRVSQGML